MEKLENARAEYEKIEIPEELRERVASTVKRERMIHEAQKKKKTHPLRWCGGGVAAAMVITVIGLNSSSAFAAAAKDIPVVGKIASVLTFRNYEYSNQDYRIQGEVPGITVEAVLVEEDKLSNQLNEEIQKKCDDYVTEAVKRAEEYKEAFLATGGTEEEFAEKNIVIQVGYEIKSQTKNTLSFMVEGTESWVSAYAMTEYYNLDLDTFTYLTLSDVLGEDYVAIANQSIKEQIDSRRESGDTYFTSEEGGFASVDENTRFYLNEQGLPVVVFDKYEVAPGSEGLVEFVIGASFAEDTEEGTETATEYQNFAEQIRSAFLNKDMEAVAALMMYPSYVGIGDGIIVEDEDDFMEISPDELFTPEMLDSLETADFSGLQMYQSGVTILDLPSITFNQTEDGTFGITGINY